MIYTLTFNPSIDYYIKLDNFMPYALNRAKQEEIVAAGKGINVAKVLNQLNMEVEILGFVGGEIGRMISHDLKSQNLKCDLIETKNGNSRINVKINDGKETQINGKGPLVLKDDLNNLYNKLAKLNKDDILIISGSLADGMQSSDLKEICQFVHDFGCQLVLDIANIALLDCLCYHPFLIKPNKEELEELFGCKIDEDDLLKYALILQKKGAQNILVSLGKNGAFLLDEDGNSYYLKALEGKVISTIGAGDSMVAGYIAKYLEKHNHYEALCFGVACGCATCFTSFLANKKQIDEAYNLIYKLYHHHKRYFFFDIDGTLTDFKTKEVVPSSLKALNKLQEANHFVAIATGRAHYKALDMMKKVGLHNMVCSGGMCLVKDDKIIQNIPLDYIEAMKIIKKAEDLGYGILLMVDDSIDVYAKNDLFIKQVGERQEPTNYIIDKNIDYQQFKNIYKIYVSIPQEDEEKLTKDTTLGHLRFVKDYLMFQYDAKDVGIIKMMDSINANYHDVVVFGDDYNDLVMFKDEWTSIAIGNACDKLKDKATYVTAKNVEDGIYLACQKFDWFKKIK